MARLVPCLRWFVHVYKGFRNLNAFRSTGRVREPNKRGVSARLVIDRRSIRVEPIRRALKAKRRSVRQAREASLSSRRLWAFGAHACRLGAYAMRIPATFSAQAPYILTQSRAKCRRSTRSRRTSRGSCSRST